MTEAEWDDIFDPIKKLEFVAGSASERKLLLFAVACCRRIWHLYSDVRCQRAVEAAELYAEGRLARGEVLRAANDAERACVEAHTDKVEIARRIDGRFSRDHYPPYLRARLRKYLAQSAERFGCAAPVAADCAARYTRYAAGDRSPLSLFGMSPEHDPEGCAQDALLRDIFGNPFRPVTLDRACLSPTAVFLARIIYDERAFDRLPELAALLDSAGCMNADVLEHCRTPGQHVRGCWAVDLLLGKS